MTEVRVKRTELLVPTPDDPERKIIMVEYRSGELPPRFLHIPKAEYSEEREKEEIKKDLEARVAIKEETLEL